METDAGSGPPDMNKQLNYLALSNCWTLGQPKSPIGYSVVICPIRRAQEVTSFAYNQEFKKINKNVILFTRFSQVPVSPVIPDFPGWRQLIFLLCQDTKLSTGEETCV